jgi:hypothetical protein
MDVAVFLLKAYKKLQKPQIKFAAFAFKISAFG